MFERELSRKTVPGGEYRAVTIVSPALRMNLNLAKGHTVSQRTNNPVVSRHASSRRVVQSSPGPQQGHKVRPPVGNVHKRGL